MSLCAALNGHLELMWVRDMNVLGMPTYAPMLPRMAISTFWNGPGDMNAPGMPNLHAPMLLSMGILQFWNRQGRVAVCGMNLHIFMDQFMGILLWSVIWKSKVVVLDLVLTHCIIVNCSFSNTIRVAVHITKLGSLLITTCGSVSFRSVLLHLHSS
jgi:hypothetical protein